MTIISTLPIIPLLDGTVQWINSEFLEFGIQASYLYPITDNAQPISILLKKQANTVALVWQLPEPHSHNKAKGYLLDWVINELLGGLSCCAIFQLTLYCIAQRYKSHREVTDMAFYLKNSSFQNWLSFYFITMNKGDAHLFIGYRCRTNIPVLPNNT